MVLKKMNHFVDVCKRADIFIDQKKVGRSQTESQNVCWSSMSVGVLNFASLFRDLSVFFFGK
jgi:hypothetical protein